MGNQPSDQTQSEHSLFVANACVNLIMALVVAVYFLKVKRTSKVRQNFQWRLSMILVAIAFMFRVLMSFYDCYIPL